MSFTRGRLSTLRLTTAYTHGAESDAMTPYAGDSNAVVVVWNMSDVPVHVFLQLFSTAYLDANSYAAALLEAKQKSRITCRAHYSSIRY